MHKTNDVFIVITSINPPTDAVEKFSKLSDCELIVVADEKSPIEWNVPEAFLFSVAKQATCEFQLAQSLPYNHYSRKMLGYLLAISKGANYIIDTDDDNIPDENWHFPVSQSSNLLTGEDLGFINVYKFYTSQKIWPRGLPIHLINDNRDVSTSLCGETNVGIWQGLVHMDPDVDALYRLIVNLPCQFNTGPNIVLGKGTISPFNSQNTLFKKELFPLLYLPCTVTFRFTDILRGLVAQPIMWLYGYQLGFMEARITQLRNPHNLVEDFESEIPMYLNAEKAIAYVENVISKEKTIEENLLSAYCELAFRGIVCNSELKMLNDWLQDLSLLKQKNLICSNFRDSAMEL
jgi:hypothetical protein